MKKAATTVIKHIQLLEELIREVKGLRRDLKKQPENHGDTTPEPAVDLETS